MFKSLKELWEYRLFLSEFTMQYLRVRYRGSALGFFWTLLNPLLLCLVLGFIFSYINRVPMEQFAPFFFSAYIPWMFFVNSVGLSSAAVLMNSSLVTRINIPKVVFPVAIVLGQVLDLLAGLAVVIGLILLLGFPLHGALTFLPVSVILTVIFVCGFSIAMSAGTVFLRDLGFLWTNLSLLWFFVSPILYPLDRLPKEAQAILVWNPFLPFLRLFQEPFTKGELPSIEVLAAAVGLALCSMVLGLLYFKSTEKHFYKHL
jgi:lipopolysaccharide transport system permease protein